MLLFFYGNRILFQNVSETEMIDLSYFSMKGNYLTSCFLSGYLFFPKQIPRRDITSPLFCSILF